MKSSYECKDRKKEKSIDGGLGLALVFLVLFLNSYDRTALYGLLIIIILLLTFPRFFYVFSVVWFKASEKMGLVVSCVLLSTIYVVLVIPVGFFVRLCKPTVFFIKSWKTAPSGFTALEHLYQKSDLEFQF